MTVEQLNQFIEQRVPCTLSCGWDNDGLLCSPDPLRKVKRVLVALDVTETTVETAVEGEYDLLLTHHPLIFRPIKSLTPAACVPRKLLRLVGAGISAIALHTRLDALDGGVNDALAEALGAQVVGRFPCEDALEGRIIRLAQPMTSEAFAAYAKEKLNAGAVNLADAGLPVQTVGLVGGEGGDFIYSAKAAGCDTYLTGRAGYHFMLDAAESGINVIEAGHFATERPVCTRLCELVHKADPSIEVGMYTEPALTVC